MKFDEMLLLFWGILIVLSFTFMSTTV